MNKVFISYGSGRFRKSLKRIGKEAKKMNVFSKIILYTEQDLPNYILNSPLMSYPQGGGYWLWKPYIIWKTMQEYPKSIVVYADAGCTLQNNMEEWNLWFRILEEYDTLSFQFRDDYEYPWVKEKGCGSSVAEWTKMSVIDYFSRLFHNTIWKNHNQIVGGLVLSCRNSKIIRSWLDIMLFHPELVINCFGNEIGNQSAYFMEHRHDQSIFSALCLYWSNKGKVVKILPETLESCSTAAVVATRKQIIPKEWEKLQIPLKTRIIGMVKKVLGGKNYDQLHASLVKSYLFRNVVLRLGNL